jgi:hypothetical protein
MEGVMHEEDEGNVPAFVTAKFNAPIVKSGSLYGDLTDPRWYRPFPGGVFEVGQDGRAVWVEGAKT